MSDNDYDKLHDELQGVINDLEGMSVPDSDLDEIVYRATEDLRKARDMATERA